MAWRDAGLLLVFSTLVALGFNAVYSKGIPLLRYAPFDLLGDCPEILDDIPTLTVDRIRPGDPGVVFVDVRPATAFVQGHIPGALFLPMYETAEPDSRVVDILRGLKKGTWIVVVDAERHQKAERMVTALTGIGIRGLHVLDGGMEAWVKRHPQLQSISIPVVKGSANSPSVVPVDARDEDRYEAGHHPGAVNIPQDDLLPPDPQELEKLRSAGNVRILVYGDEPIPREPEKAWKVPAMAVAAELAARGFSRVEVLGEPFALVTEPEPEENRHE